MGHPPRLRLTAAALLLGAALAACRDAPVAAPVATQSPTPAPTAAATAGVAPSTRPPVELCRLPASLDEVSGVALGDGLWALEDSGQPPVLTRLDGRCRVVQQVRVTGGTDVDWEDLALARGALWVADTGDNRGRRASVSLLRVPLPAPGARSARAEVTRLVYDDGPRDAEALLVHPRTGQVVVVTKALLDAAGVYEADLADGVLRRVGEVRAGVVTGGAVSPAGRRVVLRSSAGAAEWPLGDDLVAALGEAPERVGLPPSPQGEAVAYDADARSWLLVSEGAGTPVVRLVR